MLFCKCLSSRFLSRIVVPVWTKEVRKLIVGFRTFIYVNKLFVGCLFVFSSEEGEVYISFRMGFQVDEQFVGTARRIAQVVVQGTVVEKQS